MRTKSLGFAGIGMALLTLACGGEMPLGPGQLPSHVQMVGGDFWTGEIARHDRLRLAYAVWSVLSERLLEE